MIRGERLIKDFTMDEYGILEKNFTPNTFAGSSWHYKFEWLCAGIARIVFTVGDSWLYFVRNRCCTVIGYFMFRK